MSAPPAVNVDKKPLPTIALVAAGLTALDSVLAVALLALWAAQPGNMLETVQMMAGVCLLLGLAPFVVGAIMLEKHRRAAPEGLYGISWARWSILSGGLLTAVTLLIPLLAAMSTLTATPAT